MVILDKQMEIIVKMATKITLKLRTNKTDWATGDKVYSEAEIIVDDDIAPKLKNSNVVIKDMNEVPRNKLKTKKDPRYVLVRAGNTHLVSGETSLVSYILDIAPRTRRLKGFASNDYTRAAFGLK